MLDCELFSILGFGYVAFVCLCEIFLGELTGQKRCVMRKKMTRRKAAENAMSHPDYGADAIQPRLTAEEARAAEEEVIRSYEVDEADRIQIEAYTREQGVGNNAAEWHFYRFLAGNQLNELNKIRGENK